MFPPKTSEMRFFLLKNQFLYCSTKQPKIYHFQTTQLNLRHFQTPKTLSSFICINHYTENNQQIQEFSIFNPSNKCYAFWLTRADANGFTGIIPYTIIKSQEKKTILVSYWGKGEKGKGGNFVF
jgi:hypothetical protein